MEKTYRHVFTTNDNDHKKSLYSTFFILMEPFGLFRLVTKPHAATKGFVLFPYEQKHPFFLYLVMQEKYQLTQMHVCNTVIVA